VPRSFAFYIINGDISNAGTLCCTNKSDVRAAASKRKGEVGYADNDLSLAQDDHNSVYIHLCRQ